MPRFDVSVVMNVWLSTEIIAPTEEQAKNKAREKAQRILNNGGFVWCDGKVDVVGSLNLSRINKILND